MATLTPENYSGSGRTLLSSSKQQNRACGQDSSVLEGQRS